MNIKQLAKREGVSTTSVANWVRLGCPAPRSTTGAYRFVLKDVRRWRKQNLAPRPSTTNTLTEARRRKENALAGLRELELRTRQGELVERSAVEKEVFAVNRAAWDAMANIPARVSGIVAAESDQAKVFTILTREIQQAMEALSDEHHTETPTTEDPAPGRRPATPR